MLRAFFPAAQGEPRKENRWLRQEQGKTRTPDRFLWESAKGDLQILFLDAARIRLRPTAVATNDHRVAAHALPGHVY